MANYYCSARTNRFKVTDVQAFKDDMSRFEVEVHDGSEPNQVCVLNNDPDGSGWPNYIYNEETDDYDGIDFFLEVAKHLQDDEVAVFQEAGAEKLRYIVGYSVAVNNAGKKVYVSIDDIYKKARKLTSRPDDITQAQY
jgi:hypothetical protein